MTTELLDQDDEHLEMGMAHMAKRLADAVAERDTLTQRVATLLEALEKCEGCLRAAAIEGLAEALADTKDERLRDLVERRLLYVGNYVFEALAATAPAAEPWQPIETAPKDGTAVIVSAYIRDNPSEGRFVCQAHFHGGHWWGNPDESIYPPTHWMPLPAAPAAREGAG